MQENNMEKLPFLTHISELMYQRHYAQKTIESYILWIYRFISFHQKRHPAQMGDNEVEQFLNHLVLKLDSAPSTQASALNALVFLYKDIINKPLNIMPMQITQDWTELYCTYKHPV